MTRSMCLRFSSNRGKVPYGFQVPVQCETIQGMGARRVNADRIEHLFRVREVQSRTGGFTAFITWPFQPDGTEMADRLNCEVNP